MANSQILITTDSFISLTAELARLGQSLVTLSKKLQKLAKSQAVPVVKVTPKTDPEMFTKEFIQTVRQSRKDIAEGRVIPYEQIRKELGL